MASEYDGVVSERNRRPSAGGHCGGFMTGNSARKQHGENILRRVIHRRGEVIELVIFCTVSTCSTGVGSALTKLVRK